MDVLIAANRRRLFSVIGAAVLALVILAASILASTPTAAQNPSSTPCIKLAPTFSLITNTPGSSPTAPFATVDPCGTPTKVTSFTPSPIGTITPTPTRTPTQFSAELGAFSSITADLDVGYPYFVPSDPDTLKIVGAALIPIDYTLRLTTYNDQVNYAGAMWSQSKQFVEAGFETTFEFHITRPVNTGGDGFAFIIQNDNEEIVGTGGCGQGFQGIQSSLIVEFDLYHNNVDPGSGNCVEADDPSDNHIGILYNGTYIHSDPDFVHDIPKTTLDLKDGAVHTVIIRYDSIASTLRIRIDGVVDWTETIDLSAADPDEDGRMWVGFTGGTFLARQNHNILSWRFRQLGQTGTTTPTVTPSTTPTQAPATALTSTPTMTATPSTPACSITTLSTVVDVFRAPVEGNPVEQTLPVADFEDANGNINIDGYAADPVSKKLWLHLRTQNSPQAYQWLWVLISTQPDIAGEPYELELPSSITVYVPIAIDTVSELQVSRGNINNCIVSGFDRSITLTNVSWVWQPTLFSWMPLTTDSICQNSGKTPLITNLDDIPQIRGFGLYSVAKYGSLNPYHTGVDFFGYPPLFARKSTVYSIRGSGIVVGIAIHNKRDTSAARWGVTSVDETDIGPGYSLIVRYGQLYVLYGHLVEIHPTIYVGRLVNGAVGESLSLNRYAHVNGNPVNLVDPSGMIAERPERWDTCGSQVAQGCCGPEVKHWFAEEIKIHGHWIQVEYVKYHYGALGAGMLGADLAWDQASINYAKAIPYKWMIYPSPTCGKSSGVNCSNPEKSVTLCGTCIERSELGNIMFAFAARMWGFRELLTFVGGSWAGGCGGLSYEWDRVAATLGYTLANQYNYGASLLADGDTLCTFLTSRPGGGWPLNEDDWSKMQDVSISGCKPCNNLIQNMPHTVPAYAGTRAGNVAAAGSCGDYFTEQIPSGYLDPTIGAN